MITSLSVLKMVLPIPVATSTTVLVISMSLISNFSGGIKEPAQDIIGNASMILTSFWEP
jgi:hypothetical protein